MRCSSSPNVLRRVVAPVGVVVAALAIACVFFLPQSSARPATVQLTAATTKSAPSSALEAGRVLFDNNCSTCHGVNAKGGALAANLQGVGAGTVDLWVSSGWMPLANPTTQPTRKPVTFSRTQILEIANYVQSLAKGGIAIPQVNLKGANVAQGFSIFALNCAPCHTVTGAGDALANSVYAPALHGVTPTMVAEAVRSGPGEMPRFSTFTISKSQLKDLVAYVTTKIESPNDSGGLGLGGVGPVAEGFVGLFVGVGLCVLVALWIGDRTERDEDHGDHGAAHGPDPDTTEPEVVHV